jgi:hypothetical protein
LITRDLGFELTDAFFEHRDMLQHFRKLDFERLGGRLKGLMDFVARKSELAGNILAKPLKLGGGREIQVVLHSTILVDCRPENVRHVC